MPASLSTMSFSVPVPVTLAWAYMASTGVIARKAVAQAGRVGEQVLDRHGRVGLDRDVALFNARRRRDPSRFHRVVVDLEVRPTLDVLGDRIVELKPALLVEHHERRARHGLRHRVEAHDRVALVRTFVFDVAEARRHGSTLLRRPGKPGTSRRGTCLLRRSDRCAARCAPADQPKTRYPSSLPLFGCEHTRLPACARRH